MSNQWFQSLNGRWQFRQIDTVNWYPAVVPGSVHTDLVANDRIEDPFLGLNEKGTSWVGRQDWEYQRVFEVSNELFAADQIDLVCEGLDTLADIFINDCFLYSTANMFRPYHWDIKTCLKPGENTLKIVFHAPQTYIEAKQKERRLPFLTNPGMAYLRKAQSQFGWDWGPALPSMGIWRDIYLQGYFSARLNDINVTQEHSLSGVTLNVDVSCYYWVFDPLVLQVTIQTPEGTAFSYSAGFTDAGAELAYFIHEGCSSLSIPIPDPQIWWPNGYGAQPLYQMRVAVLTGSEVLDTKHFQLGLRKIELQRLPDQWGESFQFLVNGVPIFAKGANWIPADAFPALIQREQLEHLLKSSAQANMNMLRVWGGGYYESEQFYDLCDRYGLLVWQDFMFACGVYPLDAPNFISLLRLEVDATVRRLRHRACLAMWCGSNELESLWSLMRANQTLSEACKQFFYQDLPAQLKALDPEHTYWPSSPSSGQFLQKPNQDSSGDTHLWEVWHGLKSPEAYLKRNSRFVSEFGMQSLPVMETIAEFAPAEANGLDSPVLMGHQKAEGGMAKLFYYLTERFWMPERLDDLVYLSQVMQAEAVRTGVEHWRRQFPRCTGALFWQLNDCWPAISWSSIDYYGRWKALQYAARWFNAPVMLSVLKAEKSVSLYISNDTAEEWRGDICWSLESFAGDILETGSLPVLVGPLSAACLNYLNFSAHISRRKDLVLVAELFQLQEGRDMLIQRQITLFQPEKRLTLPDPALQVDLQPKGEIEIAIVVKARALARFIQVGFAGYDVTFSDNFFDLPAGKSYTITCQMPKGVDLEKARQALTVRSLYGITAKYSPWEQVWRRILAAAQLSNLINRIYYFFAK